MIEATFRPATSEDVDALLALQAAYYADDGYPFVEDDARRCWQRLLSDPTLGRAWVADTHPGVAGYVVVTLGYSLEYRGRDASVDEIYVAPSYRGQGLGRRALSLAEGACADLGVQALHIEVEPGKETARRLYGRLGFVSMQRILMTKRLTQAEPGG